MDAVLTLTNETSLIGGRGCGEQSNRLTSTTVGGQRIPMHYRAVRPRHPRQHDGMPHLPLMQWDFKDRLQTTQQQIVNNARRRAHLLRL